MGKLNALLQSGEIKKIVFGLSRSHVNSVRLFSVDKNFEIKPENVSLVYEAAINYYNTGFAVDTRVILRPKDIIEDFITLTQLMFSEAFNREKVIVTLKDIQINDVLLDYSLFSLYTLLISYKNVRIAVWEDFQTAEFAITSMYNEIHITATKELSHPDKTKPPISIDKWQRVASNIVWNVKKQYGSIDDLR